jgi:hypothetical protein
MPGQGWGNASAAWVLPRVTGQQERGAENIPGVQLHTWGMQDAHLGSSLFLQLLHLIGQVCLLGASSKWPYFPDGGNCTSMGRKRHEGPPGFSHPQRPRGRKARGTWPLPGGQGEAAAQPPHGSGGGKGRDRKSRALDEGGVGTWLLWAPLKSWTFLLQPPFSSD